MTYPCSHAHAHHGVWKWQVDHEEVCCGAVAIDERLAWRLIVQGPYLNTTGHAVGLKLVQDYHVKPPCFGTAIKIDHAMGAVGSTVGSVQGQEHLKEKHVL